MSRIGKMPVVIPKGVTVDLDGSNLTVKGPKGELRRTVHPEIGQAIMDEKELTDQIRELLDAAIQEYQQTASF